MNKIFFKISQVLLTILIFLIPLVFWPFTVDFFVFPKLNLLFFGSLIVAGFWLAGQFINQKIEIKSNSFWYPLFLIFLSCLVSTLINWSNLEKFNAVWNSLTYLALILLSFLITQILLEKKNLVKNLLLVVGVIISGVEIYLFLLPAAKYPLNFKFLGFPLSIFNSSFSPTGGALVSFVFLLTLLPFLIKDFSGFFSQESKKNFFLGATVLSLATLIIITGLGVFLFQLVSLNKPLLLPLQIGWAIAVETLKNPLNALVGVGPGQFLTAFTRFKPIGINANNNLWQVRFFNSTNELFQVLTTIGILGLSSFIYLIAKYLKNSRNQPEFWAAGILILTLFLVPANFVYYFLLVLWLTFLGKTEEKRTFSLTAQRVTPFGAIGAMLFGLAFYLLGRNLLAEINFQKSLVAAAENRGADTYNLQIKAISQNPYKADFHFGYSQTNLALANSLASKKDLTDQERQTITQLVQQAIREARNAVALAPQNVIFWENLSSVYRQLINFAQGADQWAIASANQTIRLEPNNPQLYLNLGGLYYSLNQFDQAIDLFKTSVALKPDFANGWYNLAAAYKGKGEWQKALDALNQTARFVALDSPDYSKVQKEIEEVKAKLPKAEEKPTKKGEETLKLPEPLPSPKDEITPIELPEINKTEPESQSPEEP